MTATHRVLLVRHAEASFTPAGGTDHDRVLTDYGREQADEIGRRLASGALPTPTLVLASTAARAQETWARASDTAQIAPEIDARRDFYGASVDELADALAELPESVKVAAIVGHAPEVPGLAASVVNALPADQPAYGWPAGCVGIVEIDGPWVEWFDGARLVAWLPTEPGAS